MTQQRGIQKLILFVMLFFSSCNKEGEERHHFVSWMQNDGKVKVLCTTAMVTDLVQSVGGDFVDCLTLIQGQSDPHTYQLVKGDNEKFHRADQIFFNGLGLEHGPSLADVLKDNQKV